MENSTLYPIIGSLPTAVSDTGTRLEQTSKVTLGPAGSVSAGLFSASLSLEGVIPTSPSNYGELGVAASFCYQAGVASGMSLRLVGASAGFEIGLAHNEPSREFYAEYGAAQAAFGPVSGSIDDTGGYEVNLALSPTFGFSGGAMQCQQSQINIDLIETFAGKKLADYVWENLPADVRGALERPMPDYGDGAPGE